MEPSLLLGRQKALAFAKQTASLMSDAPPPAPPSVVQADAHQTIRGRLASLIIQVNRGQPSEEREWITRAKIVSQKMAEELMPGWANTAHSIGFDLDKMPFVLYFEWTGPIASHKAILLPETRENPTKGKEWAALGCRANSSNQFIALTYFSENETTLKSLFAWPSARDAVYYLLENYLNG